MFYDIKCIGREMKCTYEYFEFIEPFEKIAIELESYIDMWDENATVLYIYYWFLKENMMRSNSKLEMFKSIQGFGF